MVLGTYVYSNLNKTHIYAATKQVIADESIKDQVQAGLDSVQIGTVERQDILDVVEYIATHTFVPADTDLTPIVDAIEEILYSWNEQINKDNIIQVFKDQVENTLIYDNLDLSTSTLELEEQKASIREDYFTQIETIVNSEDFSNTSQENAEVIVNAVNSQTGLNYGISDVLMEFNSDTAERINAKNLRLAIIEIIGIDYGYVNEETGDILYLEELDQAIDEIGVYALSDEEITSVVARYIELITVSAPDVDYDTMITKIKDKLLFLDLGPVQVGNDMVIDLTPTEYNKGVTNIEKTDVFLTVNEKDKQNYITKIDDNSISVSSKTVMQNINVEDVNIKAQLKQPKFKVSVFGGATINFEDDDAWKVLTNDGSEYRWEYIETFFEQGIGLLKSVDKLSDLEALPDKFLSNGMIIYVKSTGVYYTLIDKETRTWDVFHQNDLTIGRPVTREVVYKGIKLGHGDTGSDLKMSRFTTTVVDSEGEYVNLEDYMDYTQPNLLSFKNVGFTAARLNIDEGSIIVNPNSVFETPFDKAMVITLNGVFNVVGAYIEFETYSEDMCTKTGLEDLPKSLVNPYF